MLGVPGMLHRARDSPRRAQSGERLGASISYPVQYVVATINSSARH